MGHSFYQSFHDPEPRDNYPPRDVKGYRESFDLLLTIGHYTGGQFHLPGLGFSLLYDLGTVVALAGNVLQHELCPVAGDRACLAHFWHRKVGERLGVKEPLGDNGGSDSKSII